jgi:hypothetical protein
MNLYTGWIAVARLGSVTKFTCHFLPGLGEDRNQSWHRRRSLYSYHE